MGRWKETLEPNISVQEVVKKRALAPVAGQDLVVGCVIISDSGQATPQLITSQEEFLKTYSRYNETKDITPEYINSLNDLYEGDIKNTASTMWQNAYKLAGSTSILVVRASKGNVAYAKDFSKNEYVIKDGEILKKVPSFKLVLDKTSANGFAIDVDGIGIIGNLRDENGPLYDEQADNLRDVVEILNDSSRFFSPNPVFYKDVKGEVKADLLDNDVTSVIFPEVYLGKKFLGTENFVNTLSGSESESDPGMYGLPSGVMYIIPANPKYGTSDNQEVYNLNKENFSDFEIPSSYVINVFNTTSPSKLRIRRFNHDAVRSKAASGITNLTETGGDSPYEIIKETLDSYTNSGKLTPSQSVLNRDFFEIAVLDSSLNSEEISRFNVGNIPGYGDVSINDVADNLEMLGFSLPEDLHELGLGYYGYDGDNFMWISTGKTDITEFSEEEAARIEMDSSSPVPYTSLDNLYQTKRDAAVGTICLVTGEGYYEYTKVPDNVFADVTINTKDNHIINIDENDLIKALELIEQDEVYTTEGLCDLGNTSSGFQKAMAGLATSDANYFYPISTVDSTNYLTIGQSIASTFKNLDSYKLYASAPWDVNSSTFSWDFRVSPSVLYWEAVSRNRSSNEEFHGVFGQRCGIVNYENPTVEFNKKTRQLLLSKKVNTTLWDNQISRWLFNDNYTKQSFDSIMSDEGNSRLNIRISKAVPTILKPFIGEKITEKLCADVEGALDLFFKSVILPMRCTVDAYQIFCKYDENLAAQNKIKVVINVRYQRSLKFVNVVNNSFDVGMDISSDF